VLDRERRLVTVLFADIVGFTALADEVDPEVLQELVSGIFQALTDEAVTYEGTIEKFIGDAVFVIFGAPLAHEDDPQRALRSAIGMQRVFGEHAARLKKERGLEIGLRIGVNTGIVVAGQVRPGAGGVGVMGDTVNTASRLQAAATPGETFVTQATFRLTNREFAFREVGPIVMKGKDEPVFAYALTGERTERGERTVTSAPLVGRWMELSRLDLAFQSARTGRTEVVLVTGEPGIGKSRLISEFLGLAASGEDASAPAPRVLRWTFSRVNQRSYAGFIDALLDAVGIDPASPDAAARLEDAAQRFGLATSAPALLARFLGVAGESEAFDESDERKRDQYIAIFDLLSALARERPLVYVLEDLHYADSASLDLLWFVTARPSRVPMLFLLAQRLAQGAPEPRPSRTNFTQLVLDPLTSEEATRIIDAAIDWAPAELRERIVARAGGNPFFIEESIRALVDSGAVERGESGEFRLRPEARRLAVPATLHAVIASRIDRLPPIARECIQLASVIGQRFGDRVLRESGGQAVAGAVDMLIAADLVLDATPGERREGRYRFKHAVTQEVAYNTLLVRRRVELHRKVAAAMEAVLEEQLPDFYPALAHHYLVGEEPQKAADYSWKAARRALTVHAHVEALRLAEQTFELREKLGDAKGATDALFVAARVRRYRGENDLAMAHLRRALDLLDAKEASGLDIAWVIAAMTELSTRWDAKLPDLHELIERGLRLAGPEPTRARARLLTAKAFAPRKEAAVTDADWEASLRTANEALSIAEELGLLREVSASLDAVGFGLRELGRYREAYETHQRRLPIAQSLQDSDELIDALSMASEAAQVLGDLEEAIELGTRAREIALTTEKPRLGVNAIQAEVRARVLTGAFAAALDAAGRASHFAELVPQPIRNELFWLAEAAAAAVDSDEEKAYRERIVEEDGEPWALAAGDLLAAVYGGRTEPEAWHAARRTGFPRTMTGKVLWGPVLCLTAARWGIDDEAFEEAITRVVELTGSARGRALLTQAQGVRALRRGEHALAEQMLFDAVQAFGTLRLDYARATALADQSQAITARGRAADAKTVRSEAIALADSLGAVALARSIEGATAAV